ncbi:MAG TPA: hypothetical protein VFV51_01765 [Vicinamibacterales bacterium]|nr:hypothetical protein [Vicinamibacterales bacterium]
MRSASALLLLFAAGVAVSASDALTRQQGDAFAKKVVVVQNHANEGVKKPLSTSFTQVETNSYLKYNATELLPTGLTQPEITMHGQNRVSAKAIVDLDVVRKKQSSGGWFDPTSYLTGKLLVTAAGRVITGDGKGRVELESAEVSGVPIPKTFLNQMVSFFTRTEDNPRGSTVDDVFELPAKIKRIDSEQGRFTVYQ